VVAVVDALALALVVVVLVAEVLMMTEEAGTVEADPY
jgi:hypothetical protein